MNGRSFVLEFGEGRRFVVRQAGTSRMRSQRVNEMNASVRALMLPLRRRIDWIIHHLSTWGTGVQ